MVADDFWKPCEATIDSFDGAMKLVHGVFEEWSQKGAVFAWRGQVAAHWALHSSLYRRVMWTRGTADPPEEKDIHKEEADIVKEVHRWGLHVNPQHGRLSALAQLAMLQHFGSPTRMIDVTFNPLIGLWFAVEQQWDNGMECHAKTDGRLFAIDVSSRIINDDEARRGWEDDLELPWPAPDEDDRSREWTTGVWAWRPARFDQRIAAQNGGFLLGGVPGSSGPGGSPVQWPNGKGKWKIDKVRRAVSVPLHFHKVEAGRGANPQTPAYTIRVSAAAKSEIRKRLQELYGYRHSTIYPDYPGFALYGRPRLKSRP